MPAAKGFLKDLNAEYNFGKSKGSTTIGYFALTPSCHNECMQLVLICIGYFMKLVEGARDFQGYGWHQSQNPTNFQKLKINVACVIFVLLPFFNNSLKFVKWQQP